MTLKVKLRLSKQCEAFFQTVCRDGKLTTRPQNWGEKVSIVKQSGLQKSSCLFMWLTKWQVGS